MCTAICRGGLFGRTLDLEFSYGETVTITPRSFRFKFRRAGELTTHLAMIGMAYVRDGYPLYYDAANEKGLCMAGLNFPHSAVYLAEGGSRQNVSPFEFIPWVLGRCGGIDEARALVERTRLVNIDFSADLLLSGLHWMVSDGRRSFVVESRTDGLCVLDNPVGVLTNEPPFEHQLLDLSRYMHLSPRQAEDRFAEGLYLEPYSRGSGAFGLPGDWSSASRFVRAAFVSGNSSEDGDVGQFFHLLDAVSVPCGAVLTEDGGVDLTQYACCVGADGVYRYTTYGNRRITAVDMRAVDLDGGELVSYPLRKEQDVFREN